MYSEQVHKLEIKHISRRENEVNMQDTQVNNLRNIQLEVWKLLPDNAKEMWLNMMLQEKETINGML